MATLFGNTLLKGVNQTKTEVEIKAKIEKLQKDLEKESNPLYFIYGTAQLRVLAWILDIE